MSGRVKGNNNNALDPRTMPAGSAVQRRRAARIGASVPLHLGRREIGGGEGTVLGRKFAAVRYDPFAAAALLTSYDRVGLFTRYDATIRDLLDTLGKELSEIGDIRELFPPDADGVEGYALTLASDLASDTSDLLALVMSKKRADYFHDAAIMETTVRVLRAILRALRKSPPVEFDRNALRAFARQIAREAYAACVLTALRTELAECRFDPAYAAAPELEAYAEIDPHYERALKAFRMTAIPAYIAMMEDFDPAAARKIFDELFHHNEDDIKTHVEGAVPEAMLDRQLEENERKSWNYADQGTDYLRKRMASFAEGPEKTVYIDLMRNLLYCYDRVYMGARGDWKAVVDGFHATVEHLLKP